ncbi:HutD family protein, partial [Klebsiella pneumoniae]|uniref:HutD family protein n=1 Tax=Klebsiella pneumoniae TaxID=573 RepID=UPI00298DAE32
ILAEPPVAIVEKNAAKKGNLTIAKGYLNYLYSPAGQEIARSQGEADFEWRISMADVTTSGPFSLFPNKQRIISVLDGQGMVLHVDDLPAKKLKQGDIFAFHGESQVQS